MASILEEVYDAVTATVTALSDDDFERSTRTAEWNVRELLFHQLLDAQRALVALASTTDDPPDVDAVTYWRSFHPERGDGGAAHAGFVRRAAAAYAGPDGLVDQWRATSAAAARAASAADPATRVRTQGHVLTVADLASTLVLEASVHLLDLTGDLPGWTGPVPARALAESRRVLEELLGEPLPESWDDTEAVLRGTGRLPSDDDRLPLLG